MNTALPPDFEECGECGFDHEYEYAEAYRAHTTMKGESVMNTQQVLVVLVNGDAILAYPVGKEDIKQLSHIREKVQEKVKELNTPRPRFEEDMVKVRLQVVEAVEVACSPDGFIASLVNDICDRVST